MGEGTVEDRLQRQLEVVPDREPLTEPEARRIGVAANRLPRLRELLEKAKDKPGYITVGQATYGRAPEGMPVGSLDLQAALALLIERDELLLASFNVKIERTE